MQNPAALVVFTALVLQAESHRSISVLVFDYARVPAEILQPAMRESSRLLESAGVKPVWTECPVVPEQLASHARCGAAIPGPLTLVVHILPRGASRRQTEPNAFGFAAPAENGGFGTYACIFYDRIEQLGPAINKSAIFGHVIAHELGHLLLGAGHHSAGGIMKAEWGRDHLKPAARGALRFDAEEGHRMLVNLQSRIRVAHAVTRQVDVGRTPDGVSISEAYVTLDRRTATARCQPDSNPAMVG